VERRLRAPTSQSRLSATNGRVARELPVTPALLIRQDLAQMQSVGFAARFSGKLFSDLHLYAFAYRVYSTMHIEGPDVAGLHSSGGAGGAAVGL
jgi:hypothetical protein